MDKICNCVEQYSHTLFSGHYLGFNFNSDGSP